LFQKFLDDLLLLLLLLHLQHDVALGSERGQGK
jgi:hypothetical protein